MLKIGIITPFSNEFPFMASDFVEGLKMAFGEIKDVNFLHVETERGVPGEVTPLFRQLIIKDRVNLIVAFLDTTIVQTVQELVTNARIPLIISGMGTRLPALPADTSPFIFYNSFRMWESSWLSGYIAAKTFGKKFGVFTSFFDSGYPLVYAHTKGAEKLNGVSLYFNITHKENSEQEFLNAKAMAMQNEVDYYYASYYGKERSFIFDWFNREGIDTKRIIATSGINPGNEKTTYVTSWHRDVPTIENIQFREKYEKNTGNEVSEFSMLGYENGLLIKEAINSNEGTFNNIHFMEALTKINIIGPRGKINNSKSYNFFYSEHYYIFINQGTGVQEIQSIEYPVADIEMEVESRQPCNLFGWQNTYLCK